MPFDDPSTWAQGSGEGVGLMFGLKRKAKMWRELFVAGATNTGNVTATVGNKLVLNWHGTPTQRDGVLQMFPAIRDKLMTGVELGSLRRLHYRQHSRRGHVVGQGRVQCPEFSLCCGGCSQRGSTTAPTAI